MHKVLLGLDTGSLCLFLGPFKLGIIFLLSSISFTSHFIYIVSFIVGLCLLWSATSLFVVLYASGACNFLVLILLGPTFLIINYIIYCFALLGIKLARTSVLSPFLAFLSLGGVPPLAIF